MAQQLVQLRSKKNSPPPPTLPAEIPSSFWIYRQKLKIFFLTVAYSFRSRHALASARRFFLSFIAPETYRARQRQFLEGECNRCGHCCRINFNCPFLAEQPDGTGNCTIYLTKHAPKVCVVFPLDPADLAEINRSIAPSACTFSFVPETATQHSPQRLPVRLRKLLGLPANR